MRYSTVKLGDYLYIKGRIGWKGLKKSEYLQSSEYRIINGESLTMDGIDWGKAGFITEERYLESPEIMLEKDDILISKDGTIGKIGYVRDLEKPTTVASGIFVVRNTKPTVINTRFIYHFLTSSYFKSFITMRTEGSVIPHLYQKDFVELDFPLPELEVQNRIVSILDSIDNKIELNKEINKNLEEQIQLIFDNTANNLKGKAVELSFVVDVRDGTHDSPKATEYGFPLVTSKHLLPYGVDASSANLISKEDFDKTNERSLVETNDILISMIGSVGLISLVIEEPVPYAIKNVGLFKTSKKPELYAYILAYLRSTNTEQHIKKTLAGSTQKYISLGELRKMPIIIPDEKQLKNYNSIAIPLIKQITTLTEENKRLSSLRDILLPKLMSGELDISNLDL